jgi:hypothetical protein
MKITQNKKLLGSNIIDCVPQVGKCPLDCLECFFNLHFRDYKLPILPPENEDKIARINSVHDSCTLSKEQLAATRQYKHRFYNTQKPNFDRYQNEPVVFTIPLGSNFAEIQDVIEENIQKIMFIRLLIGERVLTNALTMAELTITQDVLKTLGVSTVATFIRYSKKPNMEHMYHARMNIEHSWWVLRLPHLLG